MNCPHCKGTGEHRPKDGPPETCTCLDEWARKTLVSGRVCDLETEGERGEILTGMFVEDLPDNSEWDGETLTIPGFGYYTPPRGAPLSLVFDVAKFALQRRAA